MTTTERPPQLAVLPDPSGLLAAIISNPEADDPRLLYADWLDEQEPGRVTCGSCQGEPRQGFWHGAPSSKWRLAGGHAGMSVFECVPCSGTGAVLDRTNSLRAEYIRLALSARSSADINRLLAAFHQTVGLLMPSGRDHCEPGVRMERGFIKWLPCSWGWWQKNGDGLRAKEWVPRVRLTDDVGWERAMRRSIPEEEFHTDNPLGSWGTAIANRLERLYPGASFDYQSPF